MKKSILNALITLRSHGFVLDPDLPLPQSRDTVALWELTYDERMLISGFLDDSMSPDIGLSLTPHDGVEPWLVSGENASLLLH